VERMRPIGCREVVVEGMPIRVRWRDYLPAAETDSGAAVVVLPGWSLGVASRSCRPLNQAFADRSGSRAIAMDARAERVADDSLWQQAEALGRVLLERGLHRVTIVGHSQGGALAANLAVYLAQQASDLAVEGLSLLDPIGLYDQGRTHLVVAFLVDALVATPVAILRRIARRPGDWSLVTRALRVAADLPGGIAADLIATGGPGRYRRRFAAEVACLARANPHLALVRSPVVLVQGAEDRVSDPRRLAQRVGAAGEGVAAALFPRSPRVCWLVAAKLGLHGLPLLRPEAVAAATLGVLARGRRAEAVRATAAPAPPTVGAN
jgi:pimeloyl-ACP methyl ester carboxylesterase